MAERSDVSSSDESEICFEKTSRACYDAERISDDGNQVFDCAFHPTQPMLACGLRNGSIRIFRGQHANSAFSTWEPDDRLKVDIKAHINCLAWNGDGTALAAGCFDGTVVLWRYDVYDGDDGDEDWIPFQAKEHSLAIFAILWNKWNRNMFATRSRNEGDIQKVLIWNYDDMDSVVNCKCLELDSKFIWDFEWISSTRLVLCTYEGDIIIYDTANHIPIRHLNHNGVWRLQWHFSLHYLVSCSIDGSVKVWSKKRYKEVGHVQLDSRVYSVDCHGIRSEGEALIACGLENGTVSIWHVTENRWQSLEGHSDAVTRVSFSPDGQLLSSLDCEEKIIIWSTDSWRKVFEYDKTVCEDWNYIRWNPLGDKLAVSGGFLEVRVVEIDGEMKSSLLC